MIKREKAMELCEEHGVMPFELILEFGDRPSYSTVKLMRWLRGE